MFSSRPDKTYQSRSSLRQQFNNRIFRDNLTVHKSVLPAPMVTETTYTAPKFGFSTADYNPASYPAYSVPVESRLRMGPARSSFRDGPMFAPGLGNSPASLWEDTPSSSPYLFSEPTRAKLRYKC